MTAFVALSFVLSYFIGLPANWLLADLSRGGAMAAYVPTFFVVAGPALAATIVARRAGGAGAVKAWLVSDWAMTAPRWHWAAVPFLSLTLCIAAFRAGGVPFSELRAVVAANWLLLLGHYAAQILMVGLLEESGWRGWLLRNRLATATPMVATLQVTIVWALWHFPRFLSDWAFAATFLGFTIALSILLTFAWARLRGGIALAALVHGSANAPFFFFDGRFTNSQAFHAFVWATALLSLIAGAAVALRWHWWTARPDRATLA